MLEPFFSSALTEAGCDEAGRGCLAGPVFAAAVVLPKDFSCPGLDDSKKLTEKQRRTLRTVIEAEAIAWCVETVKAEEIDRINILNASFLAMTRAVQGLRTAPELLLVDGNRFRSTLEIPHRCIVGGDGKYAPIAAASILAKTHRDEYMERLDAEFPLYDWRRNKGYPTLAHRKAVIEHGLSPHHRVSFCGGLVEPRLF
jgi:ribonuclease HII